LPAIQLSQSRQSLVECQDLVRAIWCDQQYFIQRDLFLPAPSLSSVLSAGIIDQNVPHYVRGDGKEMNSALPCSISQPNKLDVSLMHERSRLQGVIRPLVPQMGDRQSMEFLVDDRNKVAGGFLVTVRELLE